VKSAPLNAGGLKLYFTRSSIALGLARIPAKQKRGVMDSLNNSAL